jgi:hypothetical protein
MNPLRRSGVAGIAGVVIGAALVVPAAAPPAAARLPSISPLATVTSTVETRSFVSRLDPLTLAPVGPRVELEEYHRGYAFSPDGSQVAFGKSPAGGNSRDGIRIVDVRSVALVGTVRTSIFVGPLAWLAPHRLLALIAGQRPVMFDPTRGQPVAEPTGVSTAGCDNGPTVATRGLLVGVGGRGLYTIDASGRVRLARVAGIGCSTAGLAVAGRRAWVLPGGRRLVSIDLRTMRARVSRVRGPTPPARYDNQAVSMGGDLLAVAHSSRAGPGGVELVDGRSRLRRRLDPEAGGAEYAGGTLLTFDGETSSSSRARAIGVRGYGRDGRLRFQLLRGEKIAELRVAGGFAYAIGNRGLAVIDIRAGRVVHRSLLQNEEIQFLVRPR